MNTNRPTARYVTIKMAKVKDKKRILRQQEKNKESYTRDPP